MNNERRDVDSNDKGIHRPMGRVMKYIVEIGLGAMIYIPIFIKIGSAI
jgi:hypothetical protein